MGKTHRGRLGEQPRPSSQAVGAAQPATEVTLPPKQEVTLGPRSIHVGITGLQVPLTGYAYFPLVLDFEKAGRVEIEVMVEERN